MKRLIAVGLLFLAGCGGHSSGFIANDPSTRVQVFVAIGPTCPVEGPGMDCADKPYEAELVIVERATGKSFGPFRSADGQFSLGGIEPGEYTVRPARIGSGPPTAAAVDFTVRKGHTTKVTVRFDSGIR